MVETSAPLYLTSRVHFHVRDKYIQSRKFTEVLTLLELLFPVAQHSEDVIVFPVHPTRMKHKTNIIGMFFISLDILETTIVSIDMEILKVKI